MNESNLQRVFIDRGCFPHQAHFATAFFEAEASRKHLLTSEPGMGKRFASAAIVNYAMSSGIAKRVLVLAPAALLFQWSEMIRRGDSKSQIMIVDRRRYRELEDSQPVGHDMWPENAVVILSLDFAKQSDVATALTRCSWDLLVVDEVQRASPETGREKVLKALMDRWPNMRVLLLNTGGPWTSAEMAMETDLFHDAAVTTWDRDILRDQKGRPLLKEVHLEWVTYLRQSEETEILSRLQEAVRSLNSTYSQMQLVTTMLLQAASSSPFTLEQMLRRIRLRRIELDHGVEEKLSSQSDAEELGINDPEEVNIDDLARGYAELAKSTEPLLAMLEELPSDSKCDALAGVLNSVGVIQFPDRRVCVFTKFADTASYLTSILEERYPKVLVLTGGVSITERYRIIEEFEKAGGILIVTEAMEPALPEVKAVVFYDLPLNPAVLEARKYQFARLGQHAPDRIIAFRDESNSLLIERLQRKISEVKEMLDDRDIEHLFSPIMDEGAT